MALLGSALLLDPHADAAFDAPKRAAVVVGALAAAGAVLADNPTFAWARWSQPAKLAAACAALTAVLVLVATTLSPHPALAWNSLRRALFFAVFIPIGASRLFAAIGARWALGLFAAGCFINVVISLAQAAGWTLPLDVAQIGGRFATGALLGNEGYVALAAALLAATCGAMIASALAARLRLAAAVLAILSIAAIAINHQVTAALALAAALVITVAMRWRTRWPAVVLVAFVAIAAATALIPVLRNATWAVVGDVDLYQRLTTYRLGAWVAALHMIAAHPLAGYGLGAFALEQQPHRLAAEIELQQRFVQPTASSFIYAHDDYLQFAAEAGLPALLFLIAAIAAIGVGLARVARPAAEAERLILLAMLACGAVAALAWFPMQIPFVAVVLLLAIGRAWHIVADETP